MAREPYRIVDEVAERITKKISREFRHNRLALFDEMNVLQTHKHIKKLYDNIYKIVLVDFADVINLIYGEVYNEAVELGFEGEKSTLDEGWLEEFLADYSPTTKYVFRNELERKKARQFEALVANRKEKSSAYKTSEKLVRKQVEEYAIELEDAVTEQVYRDLNVERVQWIAEDDDKTCSVCHELDGQIFDLDDVPPKQHWHCRCYLLPARD